MKKSIVWTAAAVAAVGFGVPAFAAMSGPSHIRQIAPTPVVSVEAPDGTMPNSDDSTTIASLASLPDQSSSSTPNSVEDISGNCDEAEHANDAACAGLNAAPGTSTPNSVEDVSGNCDEAEHANDPSCTGGATDDNSGKGSSNSGSNNDDNSGRGSNSGHGGDDSGSDDSGHGGNDG